MSQRFERGTLQRARDDTVRKVYEDAVLTFGSHKPFDPCKVVASRRNLPAGEPRGFFIGGMDSPQTVDDENARMVSDALGVVFALRACTSVLNSIPQRRRRRAGYDAGFLYSFRGNA